MEPFLTPEKLRSCGIPSTVGIHQDGDISYDEMREESRGWCQFVQEEWVPNNDLIEKMQQLQALIDRWATSD